MHLTWRQVAIILLLLVILAGWAVGLGWIFELHWFPVFVSMVLGGGISYYLHYTQGPDWMARQLGARAVRSELVELLARKANLRRVPQLYVTGSMSGANAFTVSYLKQDTIFVTPDIYRAESALKAPILAHEIAHIRHNDSLIVGFVSAFEQMIGNLGRFWMLLVMGGIFGWILLLLFWPFLFLVQAWSLITLLVYQPLAARLLQEREFLADETAARWTSPQHMKAALKNLEHYNRRWLPYLLKGEDGPLSTHPPLTRRLQRLDRVEA